METQTKKTTGEGQTAVLRSGDLFGDGRPQCACVSEKYGNCPEPVAWAVNLNDNEQWLCERCYQNVKAGAYGPRVKILAAIPLSPNNPVNHAEERT